MLSPDHIESLTKFVERSYADSAAEAGEPPGLREDVVTELKELLAPVLPGTYVCMYVHVPYVQCVEFICTIVCMHAPIYIRMYLLTCVAKSTYIHMSKCTYIHTLTYMYVHMYVLYILCTYMYAYMCSIVHLCGL